MSGISILFQDEQELSSVSSLVEKLNGWECYYIDQNLTIEKVHSLIREKDIYILVCINSLTKQIREKLVRLHTINPLLTIIYYNSILNDGEFADLYKAGIDYCFIGETREKALSEKLSTLKANHWKTIPENIYKGTHAQLSARAKKILRFIENAPFSKCNIEEISGYLKISKSHFRKEFKRSFGMNFRDFKQRLLAHYEDLLLFEKSMKPGNVYEILDYKNLSAFSRSFKSRHGYSWQEKNRKN